MENFTKKIETIDASNNNDEFDLICTFKALDGKTDVALVSKNEKFNDTYVVCYASTIIYDNGQTYLTELSSCDIPLANIESNDEAFWTTNIQPKIKSIVNNTNNSNDVVLNLDNIVLKGYKKIALQENHIENLVNFEKTKNPSLALEQTGSAIEETIQVTEVESPVQEQVITEPTNNFNVNNMNIPAPEPVQQVQNTFVAPQMAAPEPNVFDAPQTQMAAPEQNVFDAPQTQMAAPEQNVFDAPQTQVTAPEQNVFDAPQQQMVAPEQNNIVASEPAHENTMNNATEYPQVNNNPVTNTIYDNIKKIVVINNTKIENLTKEIALVQEELNTCNELITQLEQGFAAQVDMEAYVKTMDKYTKAA